MTYTRTLPLASPVTMADAKDYLRVLLPAPRYEGQRGPTHQPLSFFAMGVRC